jgi:hypothetical protein
LDISEENIFKVYDTVYNRIFEIVKDEFNAKREAKLTYSHNNYFKNIKCKINYDKEA